MAAFARLLGGLLPCLILRAAGKLQAVHVTAEWNILSEAAAAVSLGRGSLGAACTMEPAEFREDVDFYAIECKHTAKTVQLRFEGSNVFVDRTPLTGGALSVDLSAAGSAQLRRLDSCSGKRPPESDQEWEECMQYTFDVFRVAADYASLSMLALNGKSPLDSGLMTLRPNFEPDVLEYSATSLLGEPFEILAAAREDRGRVAIEYGSRSSCCTPEERRAGGCLEEDEPARHQRWELESPSATGVYHYTLCALAPDGRGVTRYRLNVHVRKSFSAELSSIEAIGLDGPLKLSPAFDPDVQSYVAVLPDVKPRWRHLELTVKADDDQAAIVVQNNNEFVVTTGLRHQDTARGVARVNVTMADNDNRISGGRPPEWTQVFLFRVTSSDGEYAKNYQVIVQQKVSHYSFLKDLDVTGCKLSPAYSPEVTDYECTWNYDSSHDRVAVTPMIDSACVDCEIQMPTDKKSSDTEDSLSVDLEAPERLEIWRTGRSWNRSFMFGERHVLPITVVSQDKFSHTTYRVALEHWAPWYMKASFSRAVSTASSALAGVMAVSSAGNVLALAKQVQFMALTTKIHGVPATYADFANNLRHFNLDFGAWLPLDFLPTQAEFIRKKEELVSYIQAEVEEGRLLLQYCYAARHKTRLMGNAILFYANDTSREDLFDWAKREETSAGRRLTSFPSAYDQSWGAGRRLEDWAEELAEDLDDDDDESAGIWAWMDDDWDNLSAQALAEGVIESMYPQLPCDYPTVRDSLVFLDLMHEAYVLKNMMESMTGSFLLVVSGGLGLGGLYYFYFKSFMKRNQRRLHMLEPGIIVFFVLDFALISFSGGASRLMFTEDVVTFFWWRPSFLQVQLFCGAGLIIYPVFFICYATWCVYRLTVPKDGNEPQLVWNTSFLKNRWSDMRCPDIKVAVRSRLSKMVPVLPRIFITYVRHCVPVLSQEGEELVATDSGDCGNNLKRQAVLSLEEQAKQREELANLDKKEEEELSSAHSKTVQKFRAGQLMKHRARAAQLQDRARDHHKTLDAQVEQARLDAAAEGADSCAPWLPRGHRAFCNIPLAALTDTWKSRKNRPDSDRLDNEEHYAMRQYITQAIEDEQRLLRYNILEVAPQDGWLKPKEPVKGSQDKWWLDTEQDYEREDHSADFGHHPGLEEYEKGQEYIEDGFGKRLVYTGHTTSMFSLRRWFSTSAAKLEWMDEPEEGWPEWEIKTLRSKSNPCSTVRYADKWQWISLEHWTEPWHFDESMDTDWHLLHWRGRKFLKFKPVRVVGFKVWAQLRKERLRAGKQTVPFQVPARDKIEIRKWVYGQLMRYMDMKLKLCYLADHHPKFYKQRSLEDMARLRFRDVVFEIETAEPNQERLIEGERHLHPHELMDYTIMRFEDLYDYDDEPWWRGCDQPEGEEIKVMFDHNKFWRSGDDPDAQHLRGNDIIPPNGYSTSSHLSSEDAEVGVKRYKLWKPDGSSVDVKMSLEMKHVVPLMRYTRQFKVNVDSDNLDLPCQTNYSIILGERKNGEQYNFTVERLCLLLAIVVLASESVTHQGVLCAWVFFAAKFISFANALVSSIVAQTRAGLEEVADWDSAEKAMVRVDTRSTEAESPRTSSRAASAPTLLQAIKLRPPTNAKGFPQELESYRPPSGSDGSRDLREREALLGAGSSDLEAAVDLREPSLRDSPDTSLRQRSRQRVGYLTILLTALTESDILVLASQCVLLWVLIWAMQYGLPEQIAGFACIVIATFTMLFLGVISSFQEIRNILEEHEDDLQVLRARLASWWGRWWGGGDVAATRAALASRVNVIVPELGVAFAGETQDAEEASHEAGHAKLTKKVAYYVHHRAIGGSGLRSVRDLSRFESDIRSSLSVALDVDQMMLCKEIPQIVATLQCVNHAGTDHCSARNDTFLTLFKPDSWEPEFEQDVQRKEEMLLGWQRQVREWMKDALGSVEVSRTCARQIQEEISLSLRKDIMGSKHRTRLKVKIGSLSLPCGGLDGRLVYVTVMDETESILPGRGDKLLADRASGFARLQGLPARCDFDAALGSEMDVPIPTHKSKMRLCVWAQMPDGFDELVGFTDEVDLSEHIGAGDDDDFLDGDGRSAADGSSSRLPVHTRWSVKGGSLLPLAQGCGHVASGAREAQRAGALGALRRLSSSARWAATRVARLWELTEEQRRASLGSITFEVRPPTPQEDEEDVRVMAAVQQVMDGCGALSLCKLEAHREHWPDLAQALGVRVGEAQCAALEQHLAALRSQAGNAGKEPEAVQRLARGIAPVRERLRREKEQGIFPIPPYELVGRRVAGAKDVRAEDAHEPDRAFTNALLDELWRHRKSQADSRQQILHYVMLSDHLKPNKNWRPDPINMHPAAIVTNEFDDVAEVLLTGDQLLGGCARFLQEPRGTGAGPLCVNGRLCFKCSDPVLPDCGAAYLYWDGRRRWVISPYRGEPVPYGSRASHASKFMWVKDPAVTPDLIQAEWHRWPADEVSRSESSASGTGRGKRSQATAAWQADVSLRVTRCDGSRVSPGLSRQQSQLEEAGGAAQGVCGKLCSVLREVTTLLSSQSHRRLDPELKECLVGLGANRITISWKDVQMERLAPFRRFLLEEFGTYQSAWAFITRKMAINRSLATRNLTAMFEAVYFSIVDSEASQDLQFRRRSNSSLSVLPRVKRRRGSMTTSMTKGTLITSSERKAPRRAGSSGSVASFTSPGGAEASVLVDFLEREEFESLSHMADTIISRLDSDGTGDITAEELSALYEDDLYQDELLLDFRAWLQSHGAYRSFANTWAELSDGIGVDQASFTAAVERLTFKLRAYEDMTKERWSPQEKAKTLFRDLDAQLDGRISLNELIPSTGDKRENVQDFMLRFVIPLAIVQDIQTDGHRKMGQEHRPCLRIQVKPQFELSPEWQALKLALDPDWRPRRNFERVEVCLSQEDFQLWRQVITESAMLHPQEWVRFYEGAYKEHPRINGVYMRHGGGIQRWADGRVYAGDWHNHVYQGHGQLFESTTDWKEGRNPPLYAGQWELGKRHGRGVMRFEQELEDRKGKVVAGGKQKGIAKVYEGSFRDDLFHGHGVLYMEKAVAQQVPGRGARNTALGRVPPPQLQPSQLLRFEGLFASDFQQTFEWVDERDQLFSKGYPQNQDGGVLQNPDGTVKKDLALENLSRRDRASCSDRFVKFFEADQNRIQKAGMPMPDLARAAYRMKGGDTMHLKRGQARYADGTEYEGEFKAGRPHGHGRMVQWEVLPKGQLGKQLAWYDGGWEAGEFSGYGKYETCHGLVYEGHWMRGRRCGQGSQTLPEHLQEAYGYSFYSGEWENNSRHGYGEMTFGQSRYIYKGGFEKNARVGKGKIFKVLLDGNVLLYNGHFQDDMIHATRESPMWWHILEPGHSRGAFYYGEMTEDGAREGFGTIFAEEAHKEAEFTACFEEGRPYTKEDTSNFAELQYLIYEGDWRNNLPHGSGIQHFRRGSQGASVYVGQFAEGKRHGRGTWSLKDGSWTYRPIPNKPNFTNWDNDLMHGIGIVEDKKVVHENVIYKKGKCQMPFTQTGPPVTGFEQTAGLGLAVKGARRLVRKHGAKRTGAVSNVGLPDVMASNHFFRKTTWASGGSNTPKGTPMGSSPSLARGGSQLAATRGVQVREEDHLSGDDDELAMIREPTDLSAPEEDVLLSGGTGENSVMNGLYFKLSTCFGHSIYRLVKPGGFAADATERYLYKEGPYWIVSAKPFAALAELRVGPGTAYVEDADADCPRAITRPWHIWHPVSEAMRQAVDELPAGQSGQPSGSSTLPDRLTTRGVVGFDLERSQGAVAQGLMLRHGSELYGRPVYESEDGGQFLYWLREGGSLRDGLENEAYAAGEASGSKALHKIWFSSRGHWVISKEIGAHPNSDDCHACAEDVAATPDLIAARWRVRESAAASSFRPSPSLSLRLQEWVRDPASGLAFGP